MKFDPEDAHSSTLDAFEEFSSEFEYSYEALNREPPASVKEQAQITAWTQKDKRKVFLGRYASRNMQKLYEELTTSDNRTNMKFDDMVTLFKDRFKLTRNQTLANFNFRKMTQGPTESFDAFSIRVKREAENCSFKCASAECNVKDTLIRDQILIGTREDEVRKNALKDQWKLTDLLTKSRTIIASDRGLAAIKQEPLEDVRRARPGPYSRKNSSRNNKDHRHSGRDNIPNKGSLCERCSNPRCGMNGKCPGLTAQCFACGKKGHFRDARICPKNKGKKKKKRVKKSRRVEDPSSEEDSSDTEPASAHEDTSSYSTCEESDTENEEGSSIKQTRRVDLRRMQGFIPAVRKIEERTRRRQKVPRLDRVKSRYDVNVVIRERKVPVFCDTGADVCIMSKATAERIRAPVMKTSMKIRPFGSSPRKCFGETTCAIRHKEKVANARFYIMDKDVETLLSGPVSEKLGIITLNQQREENLTEVRHTASQEVRGKWIKEFPTVFTGMGKLKGYKVKFHIDESVPPVSQPARPVPFHLRDSYEEELKKMLEADVIERHEGPAPWVSNSVLAPKDDGGTRVVLDMKQPNKAIKQTNIPIPRPEEISSKLAGYTVYSKLDFKSAFFQLELDEQSRQLTVFHANGELMRYKRLTMGTAPASGELNKALRPIFKDIKNAFVIQDDVIVAGKNQMEHDKALRAVLTSIKDSGMTLNPDKCIISAESVPWWGMRISKKGLSPDPAKVEAIKTMRPPTSNDEVKSLFCMLQSNKDFIPALANKTKHIRTLLKKSSRFVWTDKCQKEFDQIKEEFSKDIMLSHFDPTLQTEIWVDAHVTGLSAILIQVDKGNRQVVSVASRATTPTESRYPQIDLESLAVDFGLRRYRFYVVGAPEVKVVTDHKPLCSIFKNIRKGSIRSERIKLRHQDIAYQVVYEKGEKNPADYLSRHAMPLNQIPSEQMEETNELEKTIWYLQYSPYLEAIKMESIVKETERDPVMKKLKDFLKKGHSHTQDPDLKPYTKFVDKLMITQTGIVMKEERIILPPSLIEKALKKAHQGSHPGITNMKRRIRSHFWFPRLNEEIESWVKNCKQCQMFTPASRKHNLMPHQLTQYNAWEKVSIDLFGPMPDKRHVLVAQDMVSRFPAAKILQKSDAKHVNKALGEIYADFGVPLVHRSDNGPPFNSREFEEFSRLMGIKAEKSYPYHPEANPAEGFMKPLGKCMKAAHAAGLSKEQALSQLLANYRATPHSATSLAPGDVMFRHGYGGAFPRTTVPSDQEVRDAIDFDQAERENRDNSLNINRKDEPTLQIGDKVMQKNNMRRKFDPVYGPEEHTVVDVGKGGVTIQSNKGKKYVRHYNDVRAAPEEGTSMGTQGEQQMLKEIESTSNTDRMPSSNHVVEGDVSEELERPRQKGEQDDQQQVIQRKSGRERRPNSRYFNDSYVC